jgi:hypothetical protein
MLKIRITVFKCWVGIREHVVDINAFCAGIQSTLDARVWHLGHPRVTVDPPVRCFYSWNYLTVANSALLGTDKKSGQSQPLNSLR